MPKPPRLWRSYGAMRESRRSPIKGMLDSPEFWEKFVLTCVKGLFAVIVAFIALWARH